jgi:hypothetical protein
MVVSAIGLGRGWGDGGEEMMVGRKDKVTFNLDARLHRQLKILASEAGIPMATILHNLIEAHVARAMQRKGKAA